MEKPDLDLEGLRLDPSLVGEVKPVRRKPRFRRRFLKGPIPVAWLARTLSTRGNSAVGVGLALWHLSGLKHNEIGTSDDLEILEVSLPGEIGTVAVDPPA